MASPPQVPKTPSHVAGVTGAWLETHEPGDRKFISIGSLPLENGEVLHDVIICYQSWGALNKDASNAILINHALTGWSDVPGWWPSMVGPGLPFDTDKYFVICPNVIGGCQGSTGPSSIAPDGKRYGSRFPTLTIRDMVDAEVAFSDAMGQSVLSALLQLQQVIKSELPRFKFAQLKVILIFMEAIITIRGRAQTKAWELRVVLPI